MPVIEGTSRKAFVPSVPSMNVTPRRTDFHRLIVDARLCDPEFRAEYERVYAPLRLLAELERRSPQEVFHAALAEYLESHRDELGTMFAETQRAIAAGALNALTAQLAASAEAQADALMATLPESR
jgi:hypothetical protein